MDLGAYMQIKTLKDLLPSEPPRLRGIRLMKIETEIENTYLDYQEELFNSFVNQDIIYIHTRCGGSNYEFCGMDEWEENNAFAGIDDWFDGSYRDTYIPVPKDKWELYQKLLKGGE